MMMMMMMMMKIPLKKPYREHGEAQLHNFIGPPKKTTIDTIYAFNGILKYS